MASNNVDPLDILETSLTSVKYAFYQMLGYSTLQAFGLIAPSTTALSSAIVGFIGGAVLTVPYLILLFFKHETVNEENSSHCLRMCILNLGKELMCSSVAGGAGAVLYEGWSVESLLIGMGQGLTGPFIAFAVAYCLLRTTLGAISLCILLKTLLFS
jgi:hypothetical protein